MAKKKVKSKAPKTYKLKKGVDEPKAYCMKCKQNRRVVTDGKVVPMGDSGNRFRFAGTHKKCGGSIGVVVSKDSVLIVKKKKA